MRVMAPPASPQVQSKMIRADSLLFLPAPFKVSRVRVFRDGQVEFAKSLDGLFTSEVGRAMLVGPEDGGNFIVSMVDFPPGVRNKFHIHSSDQILIVTSGVGIVATQDEEIAVSAGDLVSVPANLKHWHGASAESEFAHISIVASGTVTTQLET